MKVTTVVGAQWGDEGKGKVIDYLAIVDRYDAAARFNGGPNAGNTTENHEGSRTVWRMLPSCATRVPRVIIGRGVVVDLGILVQEIDRARKVNPGLAVDVDPGASVIEDGHREEDSRVEDSRPIGSTRTGVGPAQAARRTRTGATVGHFPYVSADARNHRFALTHHPIAQMQTYIPDPHILAAGAHGVMLDLHHGHYPYVTSCNTTPEAVAPGLGIDARAVDTVVGVVKAYTTVVGKGPMHGRQLYTAEGQENERGSVTGRRRRIGYLDLPMLRYAHGVSGFDYLAITRLDSLSGLPKVKVIRNYKSPPDRILSARLRLEALFQESIPVEEEVPGWPAFEPTTSLSHLPDEVYEYIHIIEDAVGGTGETNIHRPQDRAYDRPAMSCECTGKSRCPVKPSGPTASPALAIVGEAPGADEDKDGRPFVGRAGQLLRRALREAGGDATLYYMDNALAHRPPGDRNPKASEMKMCVPRLTENLRRVRPSAIVALGNYGMAAVLGRKPSGILSQQGLWHELDLGAGSVPVLTTVHPSYVLRVPEAYQRWRADLASAIVVGGGGEPQMEVDPPWKDYRMIEDDDQLGRLLDELKDVRAMAVDLETVGLHPDEGQILSIAMSWERGKAVCVDWRSLIGPNPGRYAQVRHALERIRIAYHNGQFDHGWLTHAQMNPDWRFDTMLAHYCLDERPGTHGLKVLSRERYMAPEYDARLKAFLKKRGALDRPVRREPDAMPKELAEYWRRESRKDSATDDEDDRKTPLLINLAAWDADPEVRRAVMMYNAVDADYTWRLAQDFSAEMGKEGLRGVHDKQMMSAARHFTRLERAGVMVDMAHQDEMGMKWLSELKEVEDRLRSHPGADDLNLRSWKQLSVFLYKTLGLRKMEGAGKILTADEVLWEISQLDDPDPESVEFWAMASSAVFTKMAPESTNTYMLHWLGHQHWWPRLMTRYRKLRTNLQTYYYGWRSVMRGGRIRPRYRIHGTRTGRMSSTDPNVHSSARNKEIKAMLMADPGYTLIYCDYSQAEIRMLAHISGDDRLRRACDGDIHRAVAMALFNLSEEQYDSLPEERKGSMRRAAKTIAFGIIYGRGAGSLAPQLNVSIAKAQSYKDRFLQVMPRAREWMARQQNRTRRLGYSETLQGFRRRYPLLAIRMDKKYASSVDRYAVNQPIQGTVSMMTTTAQIRCHQEIPDLLDTDVLPWPHVHDGFGIQVRDEVAEEATDELIRIAHDVPFETDVRFAIEVHRGKDWGHLEEVYVG